MNILIWAPVVVLLSVLFYLIMEGRKVNFVKFGCVLVYTLLLCLLVRQSFLRESKKHQDDLQKREMATMATIDSIKNLSIKPAKAYPLKIYSSADYSSYNQNDLRNKLYWGIIVDESIKMGTLDELKPFMEKPISK